MEFEDLCETEEEINAEINKYKVHLTFERIVYADNEELAIEKAEEMLNDDAAEDGIINDDFRVEKLS